MSKWGLLATLTFDLYALPFYPLQTKKESDTYVVKCISPKIPDFDYCPMTGRLHIAMFYEVLHLSFLPLPGVSSSLLFFIQPLQSGTAWHLDGAATSISLSSLACGEALRDTGCWLTACATASSHVSVGCWDAAAFLIRFLAALCLFSSQLFSTAAATSCGSFPRNKWKEALHPSLSIFSSALPLFPCNPPCGTSQISHPTVPCNKVSKSHASSKAGKQRRKSERKRSSEKANVTQCFVLGKVLCNHSSVLLNKIVWVWRWLCASFPSTAGLFEWSVSVSQKWASQSAGPTPDELAGYSADFRKPGSLSNQNATKFFKTGFSSRERN